MAEVDDTLSMTLWNGLFVLKDTPQDVRDKITAVAMKTMASERAQNVAKQTGASIYWKDAAASAAQIESDKKAFGDVNALLE